MDARARIFVAGHRGLVGSAVCRSLLAAGYENVVTRTRAELDLRDQADVKKFFKTEKPEAVFLAAARVGGIHANNENRWEFLLENLQIQNNVLAASLDSGLQTLVFFGSSCIYPKMAAQPITEEALLTGPLEPTNEPYAIAKIAGLKLVESANRQYGRAWLSLMPTNLYGPGDNFDLMTSHVLPAMIRKFHEAKIRAAEGGDPTVHLWGSGNALREFLHVDDLGGATLHLIQQRATGLYNVGYGVDISTRELAAKVAGVVGHDGDMVWDSKRLEGTPKKLLDSSRIRAAGWAPEIDLNTGIRSTYEWYRTRAAAAPGKTAQ